MRYAFLNQYSEWRKIMLSTRSPSSKTAQSIRFKAADEENSTTYRNRLGISSSVVNLRFLFFLLLHTLNGIEWKRNFSLTDILPTPKTTVDLKVITLQFRCAMSLSRFHISLPTSAALNSFEINLAHHHILIQSYKSELIRPSLLSRHMSECPVWAMSIHLHEPS